MTADPPVGVKPIRASHIATLMRDDQMMAALADRRPTLTHRNGTWARVDRALRCTPHKPLVSPLRPDAFDRLVILFGLVAGTFLAFAVYAARVVDLLP